MGRYLAPSAGRRDPGISVGGASARVDGRPNGARMRLSGRGARVVFPWLGPIRVITSAVISGSASGRRGATRLVGICGLLGLLRVGPFLRREASTELAHGVGGVGLVRASAEAPIRGRPRGGAISARDARHLSAIVVWSLVRPSRLGPARLARFAAIWGRLARAAPHIRVGCRGFRAVSGPVSVGVCTTTGLRAATRGFTGLWERSTAVVGLFASMQDIVSTPGGPPVRGTALPFFA